MHLLLDTNVYLSFYHFNNDDLVELEKLAVCLEQDEVTLLVPEQIRDEFRRNRGGKIKDAIQTLEKNRPRRLTSFPRMALDYEEAKDARELSQQLDDKVQALVARIEQDARAYSLKADEVIARLFEGGAEVARTDGHVNAAVRRHRLGNPPGKKDSFGDAVIWESVISFLPADSDLHLVSHDGDFASRLDGSMPHEFLVDEWSKRLGVDSKLYFYPSLGEFFSEHFPDIHLAVDLERGILVNRLVSSSSFAETHRAIERLSAVGRLTSEQASEVLRAATTNGQIYRIIKDDDVMQFVKETFDEHGSVLSDHQRAKLEHFMDGGDFYSWQREEFHLFLSDVSSVDDD